MKCLAFIFAKCSPAKINTFTVSETDGRTDDGQSDPFLAICFAGSTINDAFLRNEFDAKLCNCLIPSWYFMSINMGLITPIQYHFYYDGDLGNIPMQWNDSNGKAMSTSYNAMEKQENRNFTSIKYKSLYRYTDYTNNTQREFYSLRYKHNEDKMSSTKKLECIYIV